MKNIIGTETIELSEIKFDDTNPNVMSDRKEKALSESFERFGYVQEIVIDKKTKIIADGAHRLKTLLEKGIKEEKVKVIDFKDEAERKLFRQMMNKIHGEHEQVKDAMDIQLLMKDYQMEDLSLLLGDSEQEIIKTLSITYNENIEKVDKLYNQQVTCPSCGHVFEKKQ